VKNQIQTIFKSVCQLNHNSWIETKYNIQDGMWIFTLSI